MLPSHPAYNQEFESFVPGAPDFLVEIRSKSDSLTTLKEKIQEWIDAGCRLGFLIDPVERRTYVYRNDRSVTEYPYTSTLTGEAVLEGLAICPADVDPQN